jgi:hypothetical protein
LREGEKTTPVEQTAPAARLVPQGVEVCTRLKRGVAVSVSPLAATALLFVMVTVWDALDWPGATTGKASC